ncbi:MAG: cell division protein FtsL [Deltaproteobacteria bacterium]|nr:cell division protein FtsL [Deltaproteobacteria bacterium]
MAETITRKMNFTGVLTGQDVRTKRNLKDMSFLYVSVLAAFAIVLIFFAFLWTRLMVVNIGYEISRANTARANLIEQNKRLRVEFMQLKSPERIEKIATGELGLVNPTGEQIITIK